MRDRAGDGGLRQGEMPRRIRDRRQSTALKKLVQPKRCRGWPAEVLYPAAVIGEQTYQALGGLDALPSGFGDATKEEGDPGFPIAVFSHRLQMVVIRLPVLLEEQAEIQQWLPQDTALAHQEGDQQATEPAVTVQEWMDGFELDMHKGGFYQQRHIRCAGMNEGFQRAQTLHDQVRWRGNEQRIAWPCAADPVLSAAKFAWVLVLAAAFGKQDFVDFPNQPKGQREVFPQAPQPVIHGGDVVGNFAGIVDRNARGFFRLKQQQVGQRRLCALDLR